MQALRRWGAMVWCAGLLALSAQAGGGPQNVLVVVNDRSAESLELGAFYAQARGIPPRQICHVSVFTNYDTDWFGFTNGLRDPILRHLGEQGLSNQIDYIVFSRDIPYRVYTNAFSDARLAGLTATMFYGLKTSPDAFVAGCDLAAGSENPYYFAERSFRHGDSTGSNRLYLATLLTAFDQDQALRLVDQAAAADGTAPPATFHFLHTSDAARNVHWPNYDAAEFMTRFTGGPVTHRLRESDTLSGETNVLSYFTGATAVSDATSNRYIRGAFSEHFTSYGGVLFNTPGQMSLLEWIRTGNAGAYGTVIEPCNYTNKFTEPVFGYWYTRGFNLAESQYMSVRNPYQGVLVADPLCAPYATGLPRIVLGGIAPGAVVSNVLTVTATGTAQRASGRVARLDVFLDGVLWSTVTNVPPAPGNIVRAVIGSTTSSYVVAAGNDLAAVTRGLANAVNASGVYAATNHGDRLLALNKPFGVSSSGIGIRVSNLQGSATELTVSGEALTTNLLDTTSPAREYLALEGVATTGDLVVLTVTLTNGVIATNTLVAASGETAPAVLQRVMNAVNADPLLVGTNGIAARFLNASFGGTYVECELEARTPGPGGYSNLVDFLVVPMVSGAGLSNTMSFTSRMDDNRDVLRGRGTVLLSAGRAELVATTSFDTTLWPDGPHLLDWVAYDGSGVALQGRTNLAIVVSNRPMACALQLPVRNLAWGSVATASVSATTGAGVVTQLVLLVEGKTNTVAAADNFSFAIATTNLGAGALLVQARADSSAGFSVLSQPATLFLHTDRDNDGLSDQWEFAQLGSSSNALPGGDPDGDGVSNAGEFAADTSPTNAADFLHFTAASRTTNALVFEHPARTTRVYRLEHATDLAGPWLADTNGYVAPASPLQTWVLPVTNGPLFLRTDARLP